MALINSQNRDCSLHCKPILCLRSSSASRLIIKIRIYINVSIVYAKIGADKLYKYPFLAIYITGTLTNLIYCFMGGILRPRNIDLICIGGCLTWMPDCGIKKINVHWLQSMIIPLKHIMQAYCQTWEPSAWKVARSKPPLEPATLTFLILTIICFVFDTLLLFKLKTG